jgi:DNA-binding beta-propeller fold protein YncE
MRPRTSSALRAGFVPSVMTALVLWLATPANAASPSLHLDRTIKTSPFVNSSTSMKDNEGSAYVPKDDSLWLADDNGRAVYEVDPTSGNLKRMIGSATFEATKILGGTQVAGSGRDRDIESIAYDAAQDTLYVFSGVCCNGGAQPTAFRMQRDGSGTFQVESYQPLASGNDYTAAGWNPADRKLYVGVKRDIRTYDYATNVSGPTFQVPNLRGMLGMSFSANGTQLYVAHHDSSGNAELSVVDWATKTLVPGWTFTLNSFGLRDARAVELINGQFYVADGYDGRPKGDPLRHAVYVFDVAA